MKENEFLLWCRKYQFYGHNRPPVGHKPYVSPRDPMMVLIRFVHLLRLFLPATISDLVDPRSRDATGL